MGDPFQKISLITRFSFRSTRERVKPLEKKLIVSNIGETVDFSETNHPMATIYTPPRRNVYFLPSFFGSGMRSRAFK
jgi:hypothetical protein